MPNRARYLCKGEKLTLVSTGDKCRVFSVFRQFVSKLKITSRVLRATRTFNINYFTVRDDAAVHDSSLNTFIASKFFYSLLRSMQNCVVRSVNDNRIVARARGGERETSLLSLQKRLKQPR